MSKFICSRCQNVFDAPKEGACPACGEKHPHIYDFRNSDEYLRREVSRALEEREHAGLDGLVGGLECVIINTEPDLVQAAAAELLARTGLHFDAAYRDERYVTCVLKARGSADFLVRSRRGGDNPFTPFNDFPKSRRLPNTRLETLVFRIDGIERYVEIQKRRGVRFITNEIIRRDGYAFIQTSPSRFTGNSIGFIEWTGERGRYAHDGSEVLVWKLEKPERGYLENIGKLDHAATRVRAEDRDAAIVEFLELTNYRFDFAIYVKLFNSITNVALLSADDYAMVFTSGIAPYMSDDVSGPTEKFIHNYGPRIHHMAFETTGIEETVAGLREGGMDFLIDLVGSPDEGLKQTFSAPSESTLLVSEYIHRYGDFDGFFTKSNVTFLTGATGKQ